MTVNITSISGEHVYVESGAYVTIESGIGVDIQSGIHVEQVKNTVNVITKSGDYVVVSGTVITDISGSPVTISGDHVFVESGAYVIADIAESGLHVQISGQPVTISGDHVFVESGARVQISGQSVVTGTTADNKALPVLICTQRCQIVRDWDDTRVGHGYYFSIFHMFANVADGADAEIHLEGGTDKHCHLYFEVEAGGQTNLYLYEDTTFTDDGTAMTEFNRKRGSTNTPDLITYHTPTVNTDGTQIDEAFILGTGQGSKIIGGEYGNKIEWILDKDKHYLIRATNNSGGAIDIMIRALWWEPD